MRRSTRRLLLALAAPAMLAGAAGADNEWSRCGPGFRLPERPPSEAAGSDADPETVHLSADDADWVEDGVSRLVGSVAVEQGARLLRSDELTYHRPEEVIEARGRVRLWDEGLFVAGDRARTELGRDITTIEPATTFMLEDKHGHGDAAKARAFGNERLTADDATYTTCNPGDVDWRITARHVEFDHVEDVGTARNAWLEFKGHRVLYTPWVSFPLSDRRKSGFLTPIYGIGGRRGAELAIPYYFNLAPNYDATLTARAMGKRGAQAQGEFRFLSRIIGSGRLAAEYLPSDAESGDYRAAFDFSHRHRWSDRWSTDARFEWTSDAEYFEDFGTGLSQTSRSHLPRRIDARYRGDGWTGRIRFLDFLTVDRSIIPENRPYASLPEFSARTRLPETNRALNFGATAELTYFDHPSCTTGTRMHLQPFLAYPMRTAGTFLVPRTTLYFTHYSLDRTGACEEEPSGDDTPSRLIPGISLDGGVLLERPFSFGSRSLTHTIEPRLYYLLVPYDHQDDLPNFDTGRYSLGFAQLFREERFSGKDRVGDANQVTLALTSRLLDERGGELGRASIGQIRHLRDRRVTLGGGEPEATRASDIVAEIEARPGPHWRLRADLRYDTGADRTDRGTLSVRYQPDRRSVVNAGYRLVRHDDDPSETIKQADLSFAWPLGASLRAVGHWKFALDRDRTLDAFGGLEYESCCWGIRTVVRRFLAGDEDRYFTGVFLQIELKGFTGIGHASDVFLTRSIPGYENEF